MNQNQSAQCHPAQNHLLQNQLSQSRSSNKTCNIYSIMDNTYYFKLPSSFDGREMTGNQRYGAC